MAYQPRNAKLHQAIMTSVVLGQNPMGVIWGQLKTSLLNMIYFRRNLALARLQVDTLRQRQQRLETLIEDPQYRLVGMRINHLR